MMFLFRRILAIMVFCSLSLPICALDVVYGSLFQVKGITIEQGRPVLPLTRKKYANVKILDEATYRWLLSCREPSCLQTPSEGKTDIISLRRAKTRPGMWISQVAVDQRWLLTLLIFQNPDGYAVVVPETILIMKDSWRKQIERQLVRELTSVNKEEENEM